MSKRNGRREPINVAILGAGRIAVTMAKTLIGMGQDDRYKNAVTPYAVATRDDPDRAAQFASDYGFAHSYGSYESMLDDDDVDLVYIATPHAFHAAQAIECMEHGKNVLVEKSFTATEEQASRVFETSDRTGLLCTEAIWTRYLPSRQLILDLMNDQGSQGIGPVHAVHADLSYPVGDKARMTDPALAGGALLDLGVYPLNFIRMLFPQVNPTDIMTAAKLTDRKVDESNVTTIWLANGVKATATSDMTCMSDRNGVIQGEKGYIVVDNVNNPKKIQVFGRDGALTKTCQAPPQITGFEYQLMASVDAIRQGKRECTQMPHQETVFMMRLMDALRHNWGVWYPFESQDSRS